MTEFQYETTKSKVKAKGATKAKGGTVEDTSTEKLVERGFYLDADAKEIEKKLKPIKAELLERCGNYPKGEGVDLPGEDYTLAKVSAVPVTIVLNDAKAVHEIMGDEAFYAICTVPVKALKDYMIKTEIDKVTSAKESSRRISFKKTG